VIEMKMNPLSSINYEQTKRQKERVVYDKTSQTFRSLNDALISKNPKRYASNKGGLSPSSQFWKAFELGDIRQKNLFNRMFKQTIRRKLK